MEFSNVSQKDRDSPYFYDFPRIDLGSSYVVLKYVKHHDLEVEGISNSLEDDVVTPLTGSGHSSQIVFPRLHTQKGLKVVAFFIVRMFS
jgi:hypothetical protein